MNWQRLRKKEKVEIKGQEGKGQERTQNDSKKKRKIIYLYGKRTQSDLLPKNVQFMLTWRGSTEFFFYFNLTPTKSISDGRTIHFIEDIFPLEISSFPYSKCFIFFLVVCVRLTCRLFSTHRIAFKVTRFPLIFLLQSLMHTSFLLHSLAFPIIIKREHLQYRLLETDPRDHVPSPPCPIPSHSQCHVIIQHTHPKLLLLLGGWCVLPKLQEDNRVIPRPDSIESLLGNKILLGKETRNISTKHKDWKTKQLRCTSQNFKIKDSLLGHIAKAWEWCHVLRRGTGEVHWSGLQSCFSFHLRFRQEIYQLSNLSSSDQNTWSIFKNQRNG